MQPAIATPVSRTDYVRFEEQASVKHAFYRGEIFAMTGGTFNESDPGGCEPSGASGSGAAFPGRSVAVEAAQPPRLNILSATSLWSCCRHVEYRDPQKTYS